MTNYIKFYNKLIFRVSLTILLPSVIISTFMIYILYQNTTKLTEEEYINHLHDVNLNYVDLINLKMDNFASRAKMGARYIENGQIIEKNFLGFTKDIALSDDLIYASAIVLSPNNSFNLDLGFYYSYKKNNKLEQIKFNSTSDKDYFDYTKTELDWWSSPFETLQSGWTNPYFDQDAGLEEMITYYQPVIINGNFDGIITIDVSLKQLRKILIESNDLYKGMSHANVFLLSSDSTIVFALDEELIGTKIESKHFSDPDWQDEAQIVIPAINGKTGEDIFHSSLDNQMYLAFYTTIAATNWSIVTIIPYSIIEREVINEISKAMIFVAILLLFIIVLSIFLTRSISEPIIKISKQSNEIADGNYNTKLQITKSDEVGRLAINFNNMTEKLIRREKALVQANKELQVLDEAKNNFLLLASHEIRTPLNGMIGITSIIKDMADEESKELIELLEESIERLNALSKRALEIIQMQTKASEMKKEKIEVVKLIDEILDSKAIEIHEKDLEVIFDNQNFKDGIHHGVPEYFTGVLDELISNAIKHNIGDRKIWIEIFKQDNGIKISIKNTGTEIPDFKIHDILKPFSLGEKHNDKNTGLGLNYVLTYINIFNGKLFIESKASTNNFIVFLP